MMYNLFAISSKRTIIKKNIFLERAIPKEKAFKRKIIKDMKLKNDPIPIADQTKVCISLYLMYYTLYSYYHI